MGVARRTTFAGLVALLICSSLTVFADDSKPKSAAANAAADLTSDHSKEKEVPLPTKVTEWLHLAEGGFFSEKQEVRPVDDNPDGTNTFYGIFAKEFIAKGEMLAKIPWEYIITDEESDPALSANDFDGAILKCGTARNLAKEMNQVQTLGRYIKDPSSASKYGPYIQYLLKQPQGLIPSDWSVRGRQMFQDILGGQRQTVPPIYANSWLEEDWYEDCNGDPKDELSSKAAMLVVSRADDDLLVPVYDMYNHRNGKYYNTIMKADRGHSYEVTARKDIQPGEQIYNSYNMCENCGGRKNGYGTPEIFRDYGFIEDFPQRWNFEEQDFMFDLSISETSGEIEVTWSEEDKPKTDKDVIETKDAIMKELKRLVKKRKLIWKTEYQNGKSTIKESEWNSIWNFHDAMVNALSYAFNDINENDDEDLPVGKDTCSADGVCGINYFDELGWEEDTTKYNRHTCENKEIMRFPDYFMLEGLQTHYQLLNFAFREEHEDICMDLEDTVQICSSYRPHYHEFSSHFAARFVDNIKRVVFVGGGDSMMLHEILKYPSLEKVVGLELDQTVVRKSFKYFRTQAHFDNDKVEWWFGDATKSLLLLPEDYWASFDLVIVDLSETVMAFSVTEKLDVFDALALLLNPEGVMVKNEHYMDTMSQTFDYTLQIYLDQNPKICSQCMIFGSNKADFFHKPVVEHGVETLLLPPVAELKDRFDYFHDFRKNNATADGKCNLDTEEEKGTNQTKSAGLLHILDAEDVGVALDNDTIRKIIMAAVKAEGFTTIESNKEIIPAKVQITAQPDDHSSTMINVVFKEGYASARIWPNHSYIAVDVGVWGSFQNVDKLRHRIGKDLEAKTASFFRVVVGGMFGSSTWEEDRDKIGPQIVQHRNCDVSTTKNADFSDNVKKTILDEATNLVGSQKTMAAVFCGVEGTDKCPSVDVLEQHPMVSKVIPIWTCPELSSSGEEDKSGKFIKMTQCEDEVLSTLMSGRGLEGEGIGLLVLDDSAPLVMGQVLHSILSVQLHQDMLLSADNHFVMSFSDDLKSNEWRFNILERYRKEVYHDPVKLVQFDINVGEADMKLHILSSSETIGFINIQSLEQKLNGRLSQSSAEASAEVTSITGGLFVFQHNYDPHEYLHEDYSTEPGDKQWESQRSLGRKTVIQYDKIEGKQMPNSNDFVSVIDSILILHEIYDFEVYTDVGDGTVVVSDNKLGSIIAIWDGRDHVDLNIFLHDDTESEINELIGGFEDLTKSMMNRGLRDDFPRGTGRVMNFREDMTYTGYDSITDLRPYVDL